MKKTLGENEKSILFIFARLGIYSLVVEEKI